MARRHVFIQGWQSLGSPCRVGVGLAGLCAALWFISCKQKPPPGAAADGKSLVGIGASVQRPQPGAPQLPPELASAAAADASTPKQPASFQWAGPWLVVTDAAAAAYAEPSSEKKQKIGWLRNGGRVPVESEPALRGGDCKHGWYKIVNAGYLCGDAGTTDANNPKVRIALRAPNLEEVLPYQYARNAKHGTPLYRSVPSREQMLEYEPYLKPKPKQEPNLAEPVDGGAPNALGAPPLPLDAGVQSDAQVQWWQRDNVKEFLHELTKEKLEEGADDILIKRMVAGFYVAIDRTFRWDGRTWYKTTQRLVAPADRFWLTPGPKFQGIELNDTDKKLPVAWVYGGRKQSTLYDIDEANKTIKPAGNVDHFQPVLLSGRELRFRGESYRETLDKHWVRDSHVRTTAPGPPPSDLKPNEHWIDIDLKSQTLVAFDGTRPVFATLISTGKESRIEEKDHRTPTGTWRIREKHITTTMDGDGTAAGDLPYSIEDVPYVMYFHLSFAMHGAFWHQNFGIQMSHGCVNLSPLDAKRLFFFTDPPVPIGFHGVFSSSDRPGSRVVVH